MAAAATANRAGNFRGHLALSAKPGLGSVPATGRLRRMLSTVPGKGHLAVLPTSSVVNGNGNISEYLTAAGDLAAHFENRRRLVGGLDRSVATCPAGVRLRGAEPNQYDPFGNLTVDEYENAADFPYRFSTKPQDLATGLYYYGYRWYDPLTGRWPSRDPIEEKGGVNLYGFAGNDGVHESDYLGLLEIETSTEGAAAQAAGTEAKYMGIDWDIANRASIDQVNKKSTKEFGFPFAGIEFCGRICRKCTDFPKRGDVSYSATGPIRGTLPVAVFAANLLTKRKWEEKKKEIEAFNKNIPKGTPPKALPVPVYAGASCQPLDAPRCESLGEGWGDVSFYHSHPSNISFSQSDQDFGKSTKMGIWVTYGPRDNPLQWITKKVGADGVFTDGPPPGTEDPSDAK